MANGLQGYQVEDISDEAQTPDADLDSSPEYLFFPLGRISPAISLERVSLRDLLAHLGENVVDTAVIAETNARLQLAATVELLKQRLDAEITRNEQHTEANTSSIGDLVARVTALEQGRGTSPPVEDTSGMITFGLQEHDGTLRGTSQEAQYPAVPATVGIRFPQAVAETDKWFFTFPAGVRIQHIWNTTLGQIDETADWTFDSTTRTYSFEGGLVPGFGGRYSIAVVAAD